MADLLAFVASLGPASRFRLGYQSMDPEGGYVDDPSLDLSSNC